MILPEQIANLELEQTRNDGKQDIPKIDLGTKGVPLYYSGRQVHRCEICGFRMISMDFAIQIHATKKNTNNQDFKVILVWILFGFWIVLPQPDF